MTLRVYVDVVPLGVEEEAYELHEINIHNLGIKQNGQAEYSFEIDEVAGDETILHWRDDGPLVLIQKVLSSPEANYLYSDEDDEGDSAD